MRNERCHACDERTDAQKVESRAVFSLSWIRNNVFVGNTNDVEHDEFGQDLIFENLPLLSYWCILYHQGGGRGSGVKKRSSFPTTCGRWSCRVAEFHKINSNLVKFIWISYPVMDESWCKSEALLSCCIQRGKLIKRSRCLFTASFRLLRRKCPFFAMLHIYIFINVLFASE